METRSSLFQERYEELIEPCVFWNLLELGGEMPRLIRRSLSAASGSVWIVTAAVRQFCSDNEGWLADLTSRVRAAISPSEEPKYFLVEFVVAVSGEIVSGERSSAWEKLEADAKKGGLPVSLRDLVVLVGLEMQRCQNGREGGAYEA